MSQHKFDPKQTKSAEFHVTPSTSVKVPMMFQRGAFRFAKAKHCRIVELPYVGERFAMLVLLPDSHDQLEAVEKSLHELGDWVTQMRESAVWMYLPRFTLDGRIEMKKVLSEMGMPLAFELGADFSASAPGLHISAVHHVAKMEVDEAGTTAAATSIVLLRKSKPPVFRCNRPFLVVLRETSTNGILFLGRVTQPTK